MASEAPTVGAEQDLRRQVEQLTRELAESRKAEQALTRELAQASEQQAATADVLKTISRSAADLQSVLDALVSSAAHLCEAPMVAIHVQSETGLPGRARVGFPPEMVEAIGKIGQVMGRGSLVGRVFGEAHAVHIPDVAADTGYTFHDFTRVTGARTMLGVPLLRNGGPVGILSVYRTSVSPFTPRQVELMTTFADQAVIAIENARLFEAEQRRAKELTESLAHQTATSEVLSVISRSQSDVQPVFESIVQSAAKLFEPWSANISILREGMFHFLATASAREEDASLIREQISAVYPIPFDPEKVLSARAVLERRIFEILDTASPQTPEFSNRVYAASGFRSMTFVPLLRGDTGIGTIILTRRDPGHRLTTKQRALVQTFADQAVIAIENTRLFEEVQARTRELAESLEYQTATSDVLQVISSSLGRLQPVYDAMLASALRNCDAKFGGLFRYDGRAFQPVAAVGIPDEIAASAEPILGPDLAQLVATRRPIHSTDLRQNASYLAGDPFIVRTVERGGARAGLLVPLVKDDGLVGAFAIYRQDARPFSDKQIQLVQTFADQAVIAIENARLLEAEQTSTRDLKGALEYQTAISNVLGVISRSQFDLQPVLQSVVETAVRLCRADHAIIFRLKEGTYRFAAGHGPFREEYLEIERNLRIAPGPGTLVGRVALSKGTILINDALADPAYASKEDARIGEVRSMLGVPLIRDGEVVGIIGLVRTRVEPFSKREVELITTFADQAVIAIENTRLFEELRESLQQRTATADVLKAISRATFNLPAVLDTLVQSVARLCEADSAAIHKRAGDEYPFAASYGFSREFEEFMRIRPFVPSRQSALNRAVLEATTIQIPDIEQVPAETAVVQQWRKIGGYRTTVAVPLCREGNVIGAIVLTRKQVRPFTERQIELVETFADQAVIAIENARLFNEITQKSRELEIASQHKSQFVANMSHELRTPLAAILGYAELIQEGLYGPLPEKAIDALTRIRSNGKHLLGLINTVLDIAKIESGQFSLNLGEYALESVVETVRGATESLAATKKLAFKTEVAKSLPIGLGDEQRLTQVLLNLVGNAIKFTDVGEICVTAGALDGRFAVAVTDTGPGIPADEQRRVFDQFHQVDSSNTKAKGGTGLGLAIAKQIVEMHGGRIWVESTFGNGATFRMQLPIRAETVKIGP